MATLATNTYQAQQLLRVGFGLLPIIAGADKFLHFLGHWHQYLYEPIPNLIGLDPHTFLMIVGVIEIIAGIIVFVNPKIGGIIVGCWLIGIVINLILLGEYYDIALRDVGLSIGAFALARLSTADYRHASDRVH